MKDNGKELSSRNHAEKVGEHKEKPYPIATASSVNHDTNQSDIQSAYSHKEAPPTLPSTHHGMGLSSQWQYPSLDLPTSRDSYHNENPSEERDDKGEDDATYFTKYRRIIIFLNASTACFASMVVYSAMAAFFPLEAQAKGMSTTVVGIAFSSFALAYGIAAPIWGKFLPVIGARFMFLSGSFLAGGSSILFGFLDEMPTITTFTVFCILLRVVEGLGASALATASAAIVATTFPENVGTAVSAVEFAGSMGYCVGPILGSVFFNIGGFKAPFIILGGVDLFIVCINLCTMPEHGSQSDKKGPLLQVLSIPAIWLGIFVTFSGSTFLRFLDPILSQHLKKLHFTIAGRGLIFFLVAFCYGCATILLGRIADKMRTTRTVLVIGMAGTAVCFLLLGPSPLLNFPPRKLVAIIAIAIGGISLAMLIMPPLVDMFITTEWYGMTLDLGTTSVVAGLWASSVALGAVFGPMLGAILTQRLGFEYAGTIMVGVCMIGMLFICLFGMWEYQCGKGRRKPGSSINTN